MGNQRIKLSYMIPNAWFYKLKDMNNNNKVASNKSQSTKLKRGHLAPPLPPPSQASSTIKTTKNPPLCHARKSYHITRELINPPQEIDFQPFSPPKSSTKSRKSRHKTSSMSSSSSKSTTTFKSYPSKTNSPSSPPIFEDSMLQTNHKTEDYDVTKDDINTFQLKLSPIRTKQETNTTKISHKEEKIIAPIIKEHKIIPTPRRYQEKGVRLKVNSPRIMGRKQGQKGNSSRSSKRSSSLSESFAVVKSSFDPQKDFKESMMEMIVQNNIRGSKDLEDLLACYLSLNTVEYHDVIIKVFKQIWFDLRHQKQIP